MVFCKVIKLILYFYSNSWILLSPIYLFKNPEVDCHNQENCLNSCPKSNSLSEKDCNDFICYDLVILYYSIFQLDFNTIKKRIPQFC